MQSGFVFQKQTITGMVRTGGVGTPFALSRTHAQHDTAHHSAPLKTVRELLRSITHGVLQNTKTALLPVGRRGCSFSLIFSGRVFP